MEGGMSRGEEEGGKRNTVGMREKLEKEEVGTQMLPILRRPRYSVLGTQNSILNTNT